MENDTVVRQKFDEYLDDMMDFARGELDPLTRQFAKGELARIERQMEKQGYIVVEYAKAYAAGVVDEYQEDCHAYFLETNPFRDYLPDRYIEAAAVDDDLLDHFDMVAEDLSPLMTADGSEFDELVCDAYTDRDDAEAAINQAFDYASTLEEHTAAMEFGSGLLPIDFGGRVADMLDAGSEHLENQIREELDDIYGEA